MDGLRTFSKFLMIFPAFTFLYDVVYGWFVKNRFKLESLEDWWRSISVESLELVRPLLKAVLSTNGTDAFLKAPACLSLLVFPVVCYVIYFFWFRINGGKGGSGFKYKSRD